MTNEDKDILQQLASLLEARSGLQFQDQREIFLLTRIHEHAAEGGFVSLAEYAKVILSENPPGRLWQDLINRVVTDESSWFRYPDHFETLRTFIFPAVASNKYFAGEREIRILSAGCSRGQEPYTIAMTACECPEIQGRFQVTIVAVDICESGLQYARTGLYSEPEMRGLPDRFRQSAFQHKNDRWQLNSQYRAMVQFRVHNLLQPLAMGLFDIVFCRNVTIYFKPETTLLVMKNIVENLRPGGHLFVGHAETYHGLLQELKPVQFAGSLVYRRPHLTVSPEIRMLPGVKESQLNPGG